MGCDSSLPIFAFKLILIIHLNFFLCKAGTTTTGAILPDDEVSALENVAEKLGLGTGRGAISSSICSDISSGYNYDLGISCNCTFDNNTRCHIDQLDLSNNQFTGNIPESLGNLKAKIIK
ncbi:LRR domain containing protein [Trema orientale]|uniref:LRR domain containing protein n=1 Tax=Trema orientale TaxID=63057 RepID=A0A2P5EXF9_TREOI|nr:LRR domain containing protein [Trema orientale]